MKTNELEWIQTNIQDILDICDDDIHECERERIIAKAEAINNFIQDQLTVRKNDKNYI